MDIRKIAEKHCKNGIETYIEVLIYKGAMVAASGQIKASMLAVLLDMAQLRITDYVINAGQLELVIVHDVEGIIRQMGAIENGLF